MAKNSASASIRVASRANPRNDSFFVRHEDSRVAVVEVDDDFAYRGDGGPLETADVLCDVSECDVLFLRIDRPVEDSFLDFVSTHVSEQQIINRPSGIKKTGSKEFLLQFEDLCPPMKLCSSISDVKEMLAQFPIVLKPLHSFGGKGLIRLSGTSAWREAVPTDVAAVMNDLNSKFASGLRYLAMRFLEQVSLGDKRVIVVNGKVMGATLRLPKDGSWLCNLSSGGSAHFAETDEDEQEIANQVGPVVHDAGVVIFGFDTLVNDDGRRVLSEINTLNVGGLLEAEENSGRPIIKESADLIWAYVRENV